MSAEILQNVYDRCIRKSMPEKAVMAVLAWHADDTGNAWPSQETIAREACGDRRTIQRIIARLAEAGEIEVIAAGLGRAKSTTYRLTRYLEKGGAVPPISKEKAAHDRQLKGGGVPPIEEKKAAARPEKAALRPEKAAQRRPIDMIDMKDMKDTVCSAGSATSLVWNKDWLDLSEEDWMKKLHEMFAGIDVDAAIRKAAEHYGKKGSGPLTKKRAFDWLCRDLEYRRKNGIQPVPPKKPEVQGEKNTTNGTLSFTDPEGWREWLKTQSLPYEIHRFSPEFRRNQFKAQSAAKPQAAGEPQ